MQASAQPPKLPKSEGKIENAGEALPRQFGRLTLLRQLARGGMGEVYLATAGGIEGAERPSVVKIIRREHAEDRSFVARFLDEARIQSQLSHPGVAQILEASIDDSGKPFVVVEYVEGRNLGELRNRAHQLGTRVAWADAVALGVALAEALSHVHERTDASGKPLEIVHRDLSPQNVMVGYGGDVKLIDFGTARGENRRCHTVAGIVFAKPGYVAPEVANNTPGGVPADLYAFGIMLWELLAGRRFLSGEASEHLAAVGAGRRNPIPIAQLLSAPRELDDLIGKLTATRIEDRYGSAREAISELVELFKHAPSLADGTRGVRARIAHLMQRLYPSEPARSRADFVRLVAEARRSIKPGAPMPSPSPALAVESDPSMLPGTRYRIVREIGRGAMGVVHEAFHVDLGRTVALKVVPSEHAGSPERVERLRAEARAIARIRHDNLVTLHDFGIASDGRPYYAMELCEGEPLDRWLDREKVMAWRKALALGIQACRALEATHDAGIVHRDIKPGNLFMTREGTLKLLDFGIAKAENEIEPAQGDGGALSVVGTPEYMAPEQITGAVDVRSDLYALGAVLYELITGRRPHVAASTVALLDAKTKTNPEPPGLRAPQRGLPKMLDDTICRSLEQEPDKRLQSAREMREALEAALREPEIQRRRRRRIGFAAIGVVAMALGGAAAVGASKPEVRSRAAAMAEPVMQRLRGQRAEAAVAAETAPEEAEAAGEPQDEGETTAMAGADQEESDETSESETEGETEGASEQAAAEPSEEPAAPSETFAAQAVSDTAGGDDLDAKLAKAAELMENGSKVKAFNMYRKIGRNHRKEPRALKAWSEAAMRMKGWGEAHRVAVQWSEVEKSIESRLHLARMERAVGKREQAMKTLEQLLRESPRCEEARAMLRELNPPPVLARR
jgi:eukaryotic-like serine/threonine-protein kinase